MTLNMSIFTSIIHRIFTNAKLIYLFSTVTKVLHLCVTQDIQHNIVDLFVYPRLVMNSIPEYTMIFKLQVSFRRGVCKQQRTKFLCEMGDIQVLAACSITGLSNITIFPAPDFIISRSSASCSAFVKTPTLLFPVSSCQGRSLSSDPNFKSIFFPFFFPIYHVIGQTKMAQKFHIMKLTLTLASVHMI